MSSSGETVDLDPYSNDDDTDKIVKRYRRPKLKEKLRREEKMSTSSILSALGKGCTSCRKSYICPNDCKCSDLFGSFSGAERAVGDFRSHFWPVDGIPSIRKSHLYSTLLRLHDPIKADEGLPSICYQINNVKVCKSFFREATGMNYRMFNDTVAVFEGTKNKSIVNRMNKMIDSGLVAAAVASNIPSKILSLRRSFIVNSRGRLSYHINEDSANSVLEFLDYYFSLYADLSPMGANRRIIHVTWIELYREHYLKWCQTNLHHDPRPVSISQFYRIRKSCRKNYIKTRMLSKGGFNHFRCGECDRLRRMISVEELGPCRDKLFTEYTQHCELQLQARQKYKRNVIKASNGKYYLSMTIDGAGGAGTVYNPRYMTTEKGEPQRHEYVKTKNTFALVHNFGTIIYTSYCKLGKQGANLILEIVFRVIKLVMESRGIIKLKTIYIQVDNTNANKCFTILAGLAMLLHLGICEKVKLSFLVVGHTHCDVDRIIGLVSVYLRSKDVKNFEDFERFAKESFNATDGSNVIKVEQIFAMTDYEALFETDEGKKNNTGYSQPCVYRLSLSEDKEVLVYYKTDVSQKGWMPLPVVPSGKTPNSSWQKLDKSPTSPVSVDNPVSCGFINSRHVWRYTVQHEGEDTFHEYDLPSDSIRVELKKDDIIAKLHVAPQQSFSDPNGNPAKLCILAKQNSLRLRIHSLLSHRGELTLPNVELWDKFFARFPTSQHQQLDEEHPRVLYQIFCLTKTLKKGDVLPNIVKNENYLKLIDPVWIKGTSLSKAEMSNIRAAIMKDHNMSPPKKKTVRGCYDSDPDCYEGGYKSDSDDRNYRKKKSVPRKKKALDTLGSTVGTVKDDVVIIDSNVSHAKPTLINPNVSIDYVSKLIVAIHDITSLKAYSSTKLLRIEIYVNDKFLRNLANVITKCVMIGKSSMEVSEHIMKIVQVEKGHCIKYKTYISEITFNDCVKPDGFCGYRLLYMLETEGVTKDIDLRNVSERGKFIEFLSGKANQVAANRQTDTTTIHKTHQALLSTVHFLKCVSPSTPSLLLPSSFWMNALSVSQLKNEIPLTVFGGNKDSENQKYHELISTSTANFEGAYTYPAVVAALGHQFCGLLGYHFYGVDKHHDYVAELDDAMDNLIVEVSKVIDTAVKSEHNLFQTVIPGKQPIDFSKHNPNPGPLVDLSHSPWKSSDFTYFTDANNGTLEFRSTKEYDYNAMPITERNEFNKAKNSGMLEHLNIADLKKSMKIVVETNKATIGMEEEVEYMGKYAVGAVEISAIAVNKVKVRKPKAIPVRRVSVTTPRKCKLVAQENLVEVESPSMFLEMSSPNKVLSKDLNLKAIQNESEANLKLLCDIYVGRRFQESIGVDEIRSIDDVMWDNSNSQYILRTSVVNTKKMYKRKFKVETYFICDDVHRDIMQYEFSLSSGQH